MTTAAPADPPSPCTGVCTLDADDVCVGCGRTIDEIAGWRMLDATARHAVLAAARGRTARLT